MSKLLVVIPGFGPPHQDTKQWILQQNLQRIRSTYSGSITVKMFNYGKTPYNLQMPDITIQEHMEPGYIGQFLYKYVTPAIVNEYNHVIVLLDDIELTDTVDIQRILQNVDCHSLDVISPSLTKDSPSAHPSMVESASTATIRRVYFIEFFCYIMTPTAYSKWYSLLNQQSVWMWGVDLAMHPHGITMGILDTVTMKHHFHQSSYNGNAPNPFLEMHINLHRIGSIPRTQIVDVMDRIPYV